MKTEKDITVQIYSDNIGETNLYKIISTANDPAASHKTTIEALIYSVNLTSFADKVITSPTEVNMQSGGTVTGNGHEMWLPEGYTTGGTGNPVIINTAPWNQTPIIGWPTASSLEEFYAENTTMQYVPPNTTGSSKSQRIT